MTGAMYLKQIKGQDGMEVCMANIHWYIVTLRVCDKNNSRKTDRDVIGPQRLSRQQAFCFVGPLRIQGSLTISNGPYFVRKASREKQA